jgi:8-oxo-dGTP pyrophosphatase MutT (NUDIX family)
MTRTPTPSPTTLPVYCCAIITNEKNNLLLQLRPTTTRHAPGQLTCFGGRREKDESMEACLQRELGEELGWTPTHYSFACDLWKGYDFIARFFHCHLLNAPALVTEPGYIAIWTPFSCLAGLPISPWHAAVLHAVTNGQTRVEVSA